MDTHHRRTLLLATYQYGRPGRGSRRSGPYIARTDGDQSAKPGEKLDLADELADVLWVTMAIANQHGIDLADAFHNNYSKKNVRDKDRHINNPKLHN